MRADYHQLIALEKKALELHRELRERLSELERKVEALQPVYTQLSREKKPAKKDKKK